MCSNESRKDIVNIVVSRITGHISHKRERFATDLFELVVVFDKLCRGRTRAQFVAGLSGCTNSNGGLTTPFVHLLKFSF